MAPRLSSETRALLKRTFKLLTTALVWGGLALLAKLRLGREPDDWVSTLQRLSLGSLLLGLAALPVAWLVVEFVGACFVEFRARLLENAAPSVVRWLFEFPPSIGAVLERWWDWFLSAISRWRFDGKYRRRLAEESEQLHTQTGLLHATAGFSLDDVYTELHMASAQYGQIDSHLLASKIRGRESIYEFIRVQRPGSALAILGRPGGGKTTLLRHLAFVYAKNKQGIHRLRRRLPILIELRRVTDLFTGSRPAWTSPTLAQVIEQYWEQDAAMAALIRAAPPDWLTRNLASGRVLVMVDGFDEVPHHVGDGENEDTPRERVSQWLEQEMQREGQRKCLFLLASRPGGFAEAPIRRRVVIVEVQPLTLQQSERFIHAFQRGRERTRRPSASRREQRVHALRSAERLILELKSKPHLAELRVNPLLLHMVCLLYDSRGRLPLGRSDLYKETCEVLLNRDLRAPGIHQRLRFEDKLAALRPLAAYFMRSESPAAKSFDELVQVIEPVFRTLTFPVAEFLEYIAADSGLIQEVEKDRWDFAHKTFYEYLTSEHWDKHPPSLVEVAQWVERDWWRVSLLFYSAKSDDSPIIAAALARRTPQAWSLAFACLGEGHRVNEVARAQARDMLLEALSRPIDEVAFRPAAEALSDLFMREVSLVGSSGAVLRRTKLVSIAEYQLFCMSVPSEKRVHLWPPYPEGRGIAGEPEEPVLGVTFVQAKAFCDWAAKGSYEWALPVRHASSNDGVDLVGGSAGAFWLAEPRRIQLTRSASIVDPDMERRRSVIAWAKTVGLEAHPSVEWESALELGIEDLAMRSQSSEQAMMLANDFFAMWWAGEQFGARRLPARLGDLIVDQLTLSLLTAQGKWHSVEPAIDRAVSGVRYSFPATTDLGAGLAQAIDMEFSGVLGEARQRSQAFMITDRRSGAKESWRSQLWNLASLMAEECQLKQLSNGLLRDVAVVGDLQSLMLDDMRLDSRWRLEREVLGAVDNGVADVLRRKVVAASGGDVAANRMWLVAVALGMHAAPQEDGAARSAAARRYGLCLATLCNLGLRGSKSEIMNMAVEFELLDARASGVVAPWEGIVLERTA